MIMARNKGTDTIEEANPAAVEIGGFTIEQGHIEPPKREEKPNPLADAVVMALDEPLSVPVADEKTAKEVMNLLRRAATKHGLGFKGLQHRDGRVHFRTTREKRARKYTADDIRAWWLAMNDEDLTGQKVPSEVRKAFRQAHGYEKINAENAETVDA